MRPTRKVFKSNRASSTASRAANIPNKAVRENVFCISKESNRFSSSLLYFTSDTGTSSSVGKRVTFLIPC